MSYLDRAREVFEIEIAALRTVCQRIDASFDRAVQLIVETLRNRGKLIVLGIGKSGNIGQKIAATLTSTGTTCVVLNSVDALHGDLGVVNDGDLVLALSYSGETEELCNLLPALKRFSVQIIAFTASPGSTLGRYSDVVLNVQVPKEACPFNLAPTASTTAMLALGDALAMAVLESRGFRQEDFARHHPSGSIGRALLLQVKDIMRIGDRNPVIQSTATVKESLFVMSRAKAGSVSVVNETGRLIGVFTDGDLRRYMASDNAVLNRPLKEVMTTDPIVVRQDQLAADAVKLFKERSIDDLIVVNGEYEPVGLVDLQDLPKLKLV